MNRKNTISTFITVLASVGLLAASNSDEASNNLNDEQIQKKLTKMSVKMQFTDKDVGTKKRSGPENFKSDYSKPEDITLDFLKKSAHKYGFSGDKENIEITKVKYTPGGTVVHFKQLVDGIPVYLSNSSVTIDKKSNVSWANILYRTEAQKKKGELKSDGKLTSAQQAIKTAREYLGVSDKAITSGSPEKMWFETQSDGIVLVWKVNILSDYPHGDWEIIVGAENGEVIQAVNLMFNANGEGMVFDIDPLRSAHVQYGTPYVDSNDIDINELNAQRKSVALRDISKDTLGIFRLRGPYCVLDENTAYGTPDTFPERRDSLFNYTRSQEEFEDVMCYYHLDSSARYLKSLSFYDNGLDSMKIDPHGWQAHNAEFVPSSNRINMGDVGVDAGEDAEIILHEYGHAIEHNLGPQLTGPAFTGEPRAVWEGSSDYWAVTYGASADTFKWSRQGLWYDYGVGRSIDSNLIYPEQTDAYDGMFCWSSPLMNIWRAIGKKTTDSLFLQTISQLPVGPSLSGAAMSFINADYNLYNGLHRVPILNAFDQWGLVQNIDQIPYSVIDSNYINNGIQRLRFDDWDLQGTDGADNEHFLNLNHAANLRVSTCSPLTNFDTKIEIFRRDGSSTGYYNNDATCGSDRTHSTLDNVSLPAGQYYIIVDGNDGDTGAYQLSVSYSQSLQIYLADQGYNEANVIKPMFYIVNNGSQSLSNFTVSYYFTVENNKTPVLEDYYTPNCTPSLQNMGSGFFRIIFNFAGTTLAPGQRLPANGQIVVGVHYSDWSTWNKSNDYSQPGASLAISNKIAAFNSADELIYGSIPDMSSPVVPPMLDLEAFIRDEGFNENNTSKPRFYIQNQNSSTALSDFVVKYYFAVENGKTPVVDDYYTPNCSVSLQQISGNSWCAVLNFAGYTLQPGGRVPADDGIIFGLHYSDWSQWNKSNDFSQPVSNSYASTNRIAIFNSSNTLVYGTHP